MNNEERKLALLLKREHEAHKATGARVRAMYPPGTAVQFYKLQRWFTGVVRSVRFGDHELRVVTATGGEHNVYFGFYSPIPQVTECPENLTQIRDTILANLRD